MSLPEAPESADGGEGEPLLGEEDLESDRTSSTAIISPRGDKFLTHGKARDSILQHSNESITHKFDVPKASQLIQARILLSLQFLFFIMMAWIDTALRHKILFPHCTSYWTSWGGLGPWMSGGCVGSILVYWMFPIFSLQMLLFYLLRDCLQERMYYEMFRHQVHLDFDNTPFFEDMFVRVVLAWCGLCTAIYPLTVGWHILQTVPFWIPVASFWIGWYRHWEIEKRLVTVAKLVENDVAWAGDHVKNSFFLRDYLAERAFRKLQKQFDRQDPVPMLSTSKYILEIAETAEKIHDSYLEKEEEMDQKWRNKASRSLIHSLSPSYWIYQFLYSPYLMDERVQRFHFWFRLYFCFTIALTVILVFISMSTIYAVLIMQGLVVPPTGLDLNWIEWIAIQPSSQGIHSRASRAAALVISNHDSGWIEFVHSLQHKMYACWQKI